MRLLTTISFLVALVLAGCSSTSAPTTGAAGAMPSMTRPPALDTSASQASKQGLFTISYSSDLEPVVKNQLHTWTIHVDGADGQPVDNAIISIDGGMPEHNHGMPTQPIVTPLGDGNYRAEGMKFQMPGWWTVTVTVTSTVEAGGSVDTATFNLVLD